MERKYNALVEVCIVRVGLVFNITSIKSPFVMKFLAHVLRKTMALRGKQCPFLYHTVFLNIQHS